MAFETAGTLLSDAAVELGLGAVADPYGSTDASILQLVTLLKRVGRDVARERAWSHLLKEHAFTTTAAVSEYALPSDFGAMVDQAGWNRTGTTPLYGPTTPQEWSYLRSGRLGATFNLIFRPWKGLLTFASGDETAGDQEIVFEYTSSWWVDTAGGTTGNATAPVAIGNAVLLDSEVMIAGVRMRWLRLKGLDSTAAQQDYESALSKASGQDAPAPVLRIGGRPRLGLLGWENIPDTGYGDPE